MKVLIIARGYPTEKYKMNGIFEFDQAKALLESGANVIFAAIDVRSIRRWRKWGFEVKIVEGIKVYVLNIPLGRIPKPILRWVSKLALDYLCRKIVKEQGIPDVMHAHFSNIGYNALIIKKKYGIPFVLTEHLSTLMKPVIPINVFKVAQAAYSGADKLIAVSPELRDIIIKKFNKNAIYIPNIVDTKLFSFSEKQGSDKFTFVSIGGLIPRKRMDLTIKAFIEVFKNNNNVKLIIFGEGPDRVYLEDIIRKHRVEGKVSLMGLKSRKQISDYFKESDCFVLSSQAETFGVAYIEALAAGIPVIATKCGGPESFVNESNGIFVPVDNQSALEEAMKFMYINYNRYNREQIATETKIKFSSDTIAEKLIYEYKILISGEYS